MIPDPISLHKIPTEKNEIRNTISAVRASGRGEKSARCGFSSPPRVPYAPTMPRNYARCASTILALRAGTFHNMQCTYAPTMPRNYARHPVLQLYWAFDYATCFATRHIPQYALYPMLSLCYATMHSALCCFSITLPKILF